MRLLGVILRPFGHVLFALGLVFMTAAAGALTERSELGVIAGGVVRVMWRYPRVIRAGMRGLFAIWVLLLALVLSPISPVTMRMRWVVGLILLAGLIYVVVWRGARHPARTEADRSS